MFAAEAPRVVRLRSRRSAELPMPLDHDGFLAADAPIQDTIEQAEPGDLLSLHAAIAAQALVVLGEPGIGKSTALRSMAKELRSQSPEVLWVDGANLAESTFAETLGGRLRALPAEGSNGPCPGLVVVLDALDESAMVRRFSRHLRDAFLGRNLAGLHLIIGCRTADVPADLADTLEQLFGTKDVHFVDLAPLRRTDASALASSPHAPGDLVISAAVQLGAGSLAAVPLTLHLLVQEFVANRSLGGSARTLFERGVIALLDTIDGNNSQETTVDQRRALAERVAAVMLLSGKRTVFTGRELDIDTHDLRAGDVSDGAERTASGTFAVTRAHVGATLATALFGGRGSDRLAFVHASQAAFLAACYLTRYSPRIPRRQLEGLLLVAAPDGSRTVPVPLREVAAWLASMQPDTGTWLAQTDPESLIGHGPYLESDQLRATVVDALLARAAEFELGERYWTKGIDLSHPGLANQILDVLGQYDAQPAEWENFARCRVALRLAVYATSPALTERLLAIAESPDWNSHLGSLAVEAAYARDPANAVPHLVALLRSLDDPDFARLRDADDELRGHLLDALWPDHVTLAEVLPALTPRRSGLFGMYWVFLRNIAEHFTDADVPTVLAWAAEAATRESRVVIDADAAEDVLPDERRIGAIDPMLAEALVERALTSGGAFDVIDDVAALIWPRLDRYDHPTLPASLDETHTGASTAELRRALAEALLRSTTRSASRRRVDIWHMVGGWRSQRSTAGNDSPQPRSRLLDASDFEWAAGRATDLQTSEPSTASALAELAGFLFDPYNTASVDVASRQQGSVVWEHLAHWFDPVDLQSEAADRMREHHGWERASDEPEQESTEAAQVFRAELLEHFEAVRNGDWVRFWRLAWYLQFPPNAGRGFRQFSDQLLTFPSVVVLPENAPSELLVAARQFLMNEHDHADEWLGSGTYDRRAWAGYLALALLDDQDELGSIPVERMSAWAGAILWFSSVPSRSSDAERKARLIELAVSAEHERVARFLPRYVRGELRRGASGSEIEAFNHRSIRSISDAWRELVIELHDALLGDETVDSNASPDEPLTGFSTSEIRSTARYTWQRMLRGYALADPLATEALVVSWARASDDEAKPVAALAIAVLLSTEPGAWRRLRPIALADDVLGREVAAGIADDHHEVSLYGELDEQELSELYVWLATVYPPEADEPEHLGASWVTPAAQARRWRDGVLTAIANRGTEEGVRVLAALRDRFPSRVVVLSNLIRARVATFASAWEPPSVAEVQSLLEDGRRRLVRSAEELAQLVEEALRRTEQDFVRTGQLLWDRLPTVEGAPRPWIPKPEAALTAFLAHDLKLRLEDRGIAVHREVLVKPTDAYGAGDRPDILIEATSRDHGRAALEVHQVAVEVKGSWNTEVLSAQRDQLADRYMPETGTGVGMYVVGWHPKDLWAISDYRRRNVPAGNRDDLMVNLRSQASEIAASSGLITLPVVLNVPRPAPNGPADTD